MANTLGMGPQMSLAEQERQNNLEAQEARLKAKMAGRDALAAKIQWEAVEKQWEATNEAYTNQAMQYATMTGPNVTTGILATQDWHDDGINGPLPPILSSNPWSSSGRPLTVISPDPDAIFDTYPAIRRGHWTHGGFPLDSSFGQNGREREPARHSGFYRSADKFHYHKAYQPGTIISMMWHQDYAFDTLWKEDDKSHLTLNRQIGVIYSKRRKFIIVARFKEDYIALPIWTSYWKKLKNDDFKKQRVEFMQVYHEGDAINEANKLTPYEYLFQSEKRRQPNVPRQTSKGWERHMEDDWLDMKPNGAALLRLTTPVPFSYKVNCQILGSLKSDSREYLLKNWATEMQRVTMGHLIGVYKTPNLSHTRRRGNEATETVDNLIQQLNQQLNICSEASPSSAIWNSVYAVRKETRRPILALSLDNLASALEAAQTLVAEATLFGTIYETAVDTMRAMQEAKEFLRLLTEIVADPNYEIEMPSRSESQNSSPQWQNNMPEPGLGEPRYAAYEGGLMLTAAQHTQLGHTTHDSNQNDDAQQPESSQKRRKIG